MEKIINSPGFQHLAEKMFLNLNYEDLKACQLINQSANEILENPMFWLKKFQSLSKENQKDWIKVIKQVKSSDERNAIISYLQWNLKKEVVDLPRYSCHAVQENFRKKIWESCRKWTASSEQGFSSIFAKFLKNFHRGEHHRLHEDTEIVKILAPLTDNINAPDFTGMTPIHEATHNGHTEIV